MTAMQLKPWFDRVLIALFMVALGLPGIAMVSGRLETVSSGEQRRLAEWPEFDLQGLKTGSFQQAFDTFYQDHFGFRQRILGLARSVREALFDKSISEHVVIGDGGWRFFNIDGSLPDYMGAYHPSESDLSMWVNALQNKLAWFDRHDVQYVLIPIPGRMSVYSHYLPSRIRRHAGTTRLTGFRAYLDNHLAGSELAQHVVDLGPVLDPDTAADQLYFRTDTHWNDLGAYQAYAETMRAIKKWLPDLYIIPPQRLQRLDDEKRGDIARASSLPADYREKIVALDIADRCTVNPPKPVNRFKETEAYQMRAKRIPEISGCPDRNYRAIVQHDSFGVFLKQFLAESFSEVVFMHSYDLAGMETFIEDFAPDVFLDFRSDRRFHLLLQPDPGVIADLEQAGIGVAR